MISFVSGYCTNLWFADLYQQQSQFFWKNSRKHIYYMFQYIFSFFRYKWFSPDEFMITLYIPSLVLSFILFQLSDELVRATEFLLLYISDDGQYKSVCIGDRTSTFTQQHSLIQKWRNLLSNVPESAKYRCLHCAYGTNYLHNMSEHHKVCTINLMWVFSVC